MTPAEMSALHRTAFAPERGWSATEFAELLQNPMVQLHQRPQGFALSRTVAGESELLTLAVEPAHQRRGLGKQLVLGWLTGVSDRAEVAFLEVAADNHAALALYKATGFAQSGLRHGYYARKSGAFADAVLMRKDLMTRGQPVE